LLVPCPFVRVSLSVARVFCNCSSNAVWSNRSHKWYTLQFAICNIPHLHRESCNFCRETLCFKLHSK